MLLGILSISRSAYLFIIRTKSSDIRLKFMEAINVGSSLWCLPFLFLARESRNGNGNMCRRERTCVAMDGGDDFAVVTHTPVFERKSEQARTSALQSCAEAIEAVCVAWRLGRIYLYGRLATRGSVDHKRRSVQ